MLSLYGFTSNTDYSARHHVKCLMNGWMESQKHKHIIWLIGCFRKEALGPFQPGLLAILDLWQRRVLSWFLVVY